MREELPTSLYWLHISTRGIQHSQLSGSVFPLKGGETTGTTALSHFPEGTGSKREWNSSEPVK